MSLPQKLLGAGALVMALCCTVLPLFGAALGGGLIAAAGPIGLVTGALVIAATVWLVRGRAGRPRC